MRAVTRNVQGGGGLYVWKVTKSWTFGSKLDTTSAIGVLAQALRIPKKHLLWVRRIAWYRLQ